MTLVDLSSVSAPLEFSHNHGHLKLKPELEYEDDEQFDLPEIEKSLTDLYAGASESATAATADTAPTAAENQAQEEDEEEAENEITIVSPNTDENEPVTVIKAPVCPFFLRIYFSTFEIFKVAFGTVVFVPIRSLLMFTMISIGWCLAYIGTIGLTREELQNEPFSRWRRAIRWFVSRYLMRTFFFFGGFLWVPTRGKLVPPDEAPILVAAPHSSYFDSLVLIISGPPSAVARAETANEAFSGKLVDLIQAVYVSRESRESRSNTVKAIADRAQKISVPGSEWPHLLMYPEGTCGNRSCIMQFKLGAFIPGAPIQPVLIRYPNRMDHVTWTFDGPGFLKSLWLTLSQFRNFCVVEYLPVYVPSEEEKRDPALYANNVRAVMANALGIPTSDYTYEDGLAIVNSDAEKLSSKLTAVASFRNGLSVSPLLEISAMRNISTNTKTDFMVSRQALAHNLLVSTHETFQFDRMFEFLDEKHHMIDERTYLVYACILNPLTRVEHLLAPFFLMYSRGKKRMSFQEFAVFLHQNFNTSVKEADKAGKTHKVEDLIDLETFSSKVKHRLEYLKLLALEAVGLLQEYPPREHELRNSASVSLFSGYKKKTN